MLAAGSLLPAGLPAALLACLAACFRLLADACLMAGLLLACWLAAWQAGVLAEPLESLILETLLVVRNKIQWTLRFGCDATAL